MICDLEKTQPQLPLVGLEGNPVPRLKLQPQAGILQTPEYLRNYHREWSKANKDKIREYSQRSRHRNIETIRSKAATKEAKQKAIDYQKSYRAQFPERYKESLRRSYRKHLENRKAYQKSPARVARRLELYQLHKDKNRARARAYANQPETRARCRAYFRRRRRENVRFALMDSLRATLNRAFRRNWIEKPARTETLIGCTISEAKAHIERQFVNDMSWQSRTSFVIDHIVPVIAFDLRDSDEVQWAFNWRNLQPLTRHDNAVKSDTLPTPLPAWLPSHIADRILRRMTKRKPPRCRAGALARRAESYGNTARI